jgi:hypothetical protein
VGRHFKKELHNSPFGWHGELRIRPLTMRTGRLLILGEMLNFPENFLK